MWNATNFFNVLKKFKKHLKSLRHGTEKIHAIHENRQEFREKCEPVQATKRFSRPSVKVTKLFER